MKKWPATSTEIATFSEKKITMSKLQGHSLFTVKQAPCEIMCVDWQCALYSGIANHA